MSFQERFTGDSKEPRVGVIKGAEVATFSGSVSLANLIWQSPGGERLGIETNERGEVISVDGIQAESWGSSASEILDFKKQ